ncbi:hypothetical protein WME73_28300 [Sorangium sp. So ce302]|uniref:hypothetical protein n=1 Tax=unclassified Sorangium TaxID=2621164 RepID=UPI003F5E8207
MSKHVLLRRPMRPDELERARALARLRRPTRGESRVALVLLGCVVFGCALLAALLALRIDGHWRTIGPVVGLGLGAVLGALALLGYRAASREARARWDEDLRAAEVEELRVETSRAVELDAGHSALSPAVVLDLGEGQLLLLYGQPVAEPEVYGRDGWPTTAADDRDDNDDEDPFAAWWNGMPPPHAFPSERFTLTRLRATGEVLSIAIEGPYLAPEPAHEASDLRARDHRPSLVFAGTLDRIDEAIAALPRIDDSPG